MAFLKCVFMPKTSVILDSQRPKKGLQVKEQIKYPVELFGRFTVPFAKTIHAFAFEVKNQRFTFSMQKMNDDGGIGLCDFRVHMSNMLCNDMENIKLAVFFFQSAFVKNGAAHHSSSIKASF